MWYDRIVNFMNEANGDGLRVAGFEANGLPGWVFITLCCGRILRHRI